MNKYLFYFSILIASVILLSSCDENEFEDPYPSELVKGCYVVNYGNYGTGGASISKYDYETDELANFYYQAQNNGQELLSNIQFAYHYNDSVYLMANEADHVMVLNALFEQSINGVTTDIAKPRCCVASGNYLYISCWGANPDWSEMPNTYIAKFNVATNSVDETIPLPGGPEGLETANGNLYVALNYKDSVAVINLSNDQVSYIETPAVASYFVKDNNDNLYVTLVSTWTDYSIEIGLGYINTSSNELEATYILADVSSGYGAMVAANAAFTKIYVVTSAYDEFWNLTGAVAEFDVTSKSFASENFVSDILGISGLAVNPHNGNVYVFAAETTTGPGKMNIYSDSGGFIKEYSVGASPNGAFFID